MNNKKSWIYAVVKGQ